MDWYPWGDAAFDKARRENKPVFLSIGYSTCHWCHVMERESFENVQVAAVINQWFVPVKVDREERPDVDRLYMAAMQSMGLGGGWPLNVFLTPELEPFFGGTYFPPHALPGRPGLPDVLARVHHVWASQRDEIEEQGRRVFESIEAALADRGDPGVATVADPVAARAELLERAHATLERIHDAEHGGFGGAPKFPTPVNLAFLTRFGSRDPEGRPTALAMVYRQLDVMQAGGIHDALGGGFHRYATDALWHVPHFEKMLYDQAQLAWAYLEGSQNAGAPGPAHDAERAQGYADTARGIFRYVMRDLTAPGGGFFSAEDADSEGVEGRFYVWTRRELDTVLGADAALFAAAYDVTAAGNFEHGASVLQRVHSDAALAETFGGTPPEIAARLARARETLFAVRSRRPRPHLDDKVLTAWNGIMISALARGARVLRESALTDAATRSANFLWEHLRDPGTGAMRRRFRDGEAAGAGQLDDYVYPALGFLDLYGATFDAVWIERSVLMMEQALERFGDDTDGTLFESPADDPHVRIRMKDDFDGAEIAGNSVAAWVLVTLAALLDREPWRQRAQRLLDTYAARLATNPIAMPRMLAAMDLAAAPPNHVVIAGDPEAADTRMLIREFDRRFLPRELLLVVPPGARGKWERLAPFAAALTPVGGAATAYICTNYACRLPVTDPEAFAEMLDRL